MTAAGLRLRVGRHGSGPPLLLITGIGAHLDMWAPFAAHAGERELVAFDPPGAGLSQRPGLPLRMSGLARVVTEMLDVLGLGRVDVLGYSFGGGLAQELAYRAPERVRRLVLCATAPGVGGCPPRPMAALMLASPARYYHPRLLELSVGHIAGGRTAREPARARPPGRASGSCIRRPRSATPTSSTRSPGGRACRGCTGCATRPWSCRARTTPPSRSGTAACSRGASPTRGFTSSPAAGTSSSSTSPRTRRP